MSLVWFLLRTARRRPISSTLLILLDRDWKRDQDCFPRCAAPDSSVDSHLLIVVRRGRGWKTYQLIGLQLTQVCEPIILFLLLLSLVDQSSQFIHLDYHLAWSIRL